jgi:hypothetical protein
VSIYEGAGQDILALLEDTADSIIFQGAEDAVPPDALNWLSRRRPRQVIVIAEIGVLAKAAGRLSKTGYRLKTAIPLDTHPQAFQVEVVAVWEVAGQDI